MPRAQHIALHACKETTWTHCLLYKILGAYSKTYDGGIQLINGRTEHVSQLIGCLAQKFTHMVKGIGPHTYLWVFVKEEPGKALGPFFANGTPGLNVIPGALFEFEAQVCAIFTA